MATISKKLFFIPLIVALLLIFVLPVAAQSEPTLTIPTGLAGTPGQLVRIPISFNAAGKEIRNIVFAVTYNEALFTFNSFECNLESGGTNIPCAVDLNTANTRGEIDVVIGRTATPLLSIPEGDLITLLLDIKPDAVLDSPAPIGFFTDPPPSFGNEKGQSVAGSGIDGSIGGSVVNTTPVANDDAATMDEDIAVTVEVLANDSDLENNTLSVDSVTQPANGVVVNNGTNVTYTPNADFSGTDSFTYKITDGSAVSNSATVNVTVNPVNDAPVAHDDSYSTDEDITLSVVAPGVLDGDTDIDSNSLFVALVSNVAHGTLTLNPDGSFTYIPVANFNGSDSFTYTANDGIADSNIATVTITVNPVNDAPTAVINAPVASTITAGTNGFAPIALNSSGTSDVEDSIEQLGFLWSWTENGNPVTIAAAGTAYNFPLGTYNITLTVTDSGGLTDSKTVAITVVAPPNVAPTVNAGADAAITLPVNSISLNATASDDGLPFGSTLITTWTGPVGVTFADTHALATSATFPSAGSYILTLTASDGEKSVSDTVTVTINPAPNQSPTANAGQDQNLTDNDNNGSELVTLSGVGSRDQDGSITTYAWFENGNPIASGVSPQVTLALGVHSITLIVTDDIGAQGIDQVVITVLAVPNVPPTANAGLDQTVTDTDNNGSELIILNGTGSTDADGAILTYLWQENGNTIATTATPTVTLTVGTHILTLTVTDNRGAPNSDTVSISIISTGSSTATITAQVNASSDDVNQDGQTLNTTATTLWIGTTGNPANSFTGIRFNGLSIPKGSVINTARLEVYTPDGGWVSVNLSIAAEASDNSATFTTATRPSTRPLTTARVTSNTNTRWLPNTWNSYDGLSALVQEVVNRPGWQSGNSLSILIKGSGSAFARKYVSSFNGSPAFAPRLIVGFTAPVVIAPNQSPIANAGLDQTITDGNNDGAQSITLNGAGSSDPDGNIISYLWQENGNTVASGITPTITLPIGTHQLTLTVTDNRNGQSSDTVIVNIIAPPSATDTITSQVNGSTDDSNEDGGTFTSNTATLWVGRGNSSTASFTGLRFNNINIPQGATIHSARLEVYSSANNWISVNITLAAEATDNSSAFSSASRPSSRQRTAAQVISNTNVQWLANTWYNYPGLTPVIQEVISRVGWQPNNSLSLIIKGAGSTWARKFITAYDGNPAFAPRLVISYTAPVVQPPTAAFTTNVVQGTAPLAVQFTNQSTGSNPTYSWNFGDGTTSTETNPTHTFTTPGAYTVVLTASNTGGSRTAQTVVTVNAPIQPPIAAFSTDVVTSTSPLAVQFTNQSTGTNLTYSWNFGDGGTSTDASPIHSFTGQGTYTVVLTVTNSVGPSTAQTIITVNAPPQPPVAVFSADVVIGTTPLVVQFTNQSTGDGITYSWNFGDGATSTDTNPAHTFNGAGTYVVTLTVSNTVGTSTSQVSIQVTDPPPEATASPNG